MSDDHSWIKVDNLPNAIVGRQRHVMCVKCGTLKICVTKTNRHMYAKKPNEDYVYDMPICSEEQVRSVLDE